MPWINHVAPVRIARATIRKGLRVPTRSDQMPDRELRQARECRHRRDQPDRLVGQPPLPRYSGRNGKVKPIPATPKKYDP